MKAKMNEQTIMPRESLDVKNLRVLTRDGSKIAVRVYSPIGGKDLPVVVM